MKSRLYAYAAVAAAVALAAAYLALFPGGYILEPDPLIKKAQFHTADFDASSVNASIEMLGPQEAPDDPERISG